MATYQPTSPPPHRPMSGMIRPPRSNSRLSNSSKPTSKPTSKPASRASDEDSKVSVRVAVRVRPPLQPGDVNFSLVPQRFRASRVLVEPPNTMTVQDSPDNKTFLFDRVFGEDVLQDGVWDYISESTGAFLQGYNVSVMAYGQSGAGKSFTMGTSGPEEQGDRDLMGIIPRAAAALFEHLTPPTTATRPMSGIRQPNRISMSALPTASHSRGNHSVDKDWQMRASYVEIYNEQYRDLLLPKNTPAQDRAEIRIHEDRAGRISLSGIKQVPINSVEELLKALNYGSTIRQTDSTKINDRSSRSHAIFTLNLIQRKSKEAPTRLKRMSMPADSLSMEEQITVDSKLHFVDLAGSERMKNTGASGERAKEGISINGGLAILGKVISQLSARNSKAHISYRDSKLTRLLQDSLGGNAITYLIACVNPAEFHLSETMNTVQYAQRARNIQSKPRIQQISDDADKEALIARLKAEVKFLREQLRNSEQAERPVSKGGQSADSPTETEIELQTQLHDAQQSYQALTQRHAKLMSELAKAKNASPDELPTLKDAVGDSALERIRMSASFETAVESTIMEYEKTIQSLEIALNKTRASLAASDDRLNERENKLHETLLINQQLQTRLQKFMDRDTAMTNQVRDLEARLDGAPLDEEQNAGVLAELRAEITTMRKRDDRNDDYILSLEEEMTARQQSEGHLKQELSRLQRLLDRQQSVTKLNRLIYKMEQKQAQDAEQLANGITDLDATLSQEILAIAVETPLPESDFESEDEGLEINHHLSNSTAADGISSRAAEQSKFMEEKLETVNQELLDLRVEHESTVNNYAQLSARYEEAMKSLKAFQETQTQKPAPPITALKSEAGMKQEQISGQISSSRSQSSVSSSAGERPDSLGRSEGPIDVNGLVYGSVTSDSSAPTPTMKPHELEELQQLAAQKDAALEQLRHEYEDLNEKYLDKQDTIEELKAEVTKVKMNFPPSPTSNFLRRKSSQNVMSIDRAHRSLASLGNIASESFADNQDIKDQFELHINAVMHELHQRSERVSVLEGEIASVKKEMEGKMAIISGLTRERTSMKTQSPVDVSMFSNMRDQVLQSEAQIQSLQQQSAARERELYDEVEALKRSIEILDAKHRSISATESTNATQQKEEFEIKTAKLQGELSEWQEKHSASAAAVERSEKGFRQTITELEKTLTEVETARQQMAAERDTHASGYAASAAAFDADRQKYTDSIGTLQTDIEEKKSTIDTHLARIAELESECANAQQSSSQFRAETQSSLEAHQVQIEELVQQLGKHQSAVETYKDDLKSIRDSHLAELDEVRNSTSRQHREETEARISELSSKYNDQMTKLRSEIEDLEETLQQQKQQLEDKGARMSAIGQNSLHSRNDSELSESTLALQQKIKTVEEHKSEAEKALIEARAKLDELTSAKDEIAGELNSVREREQRASRLVEELEGQLASQFEEGQQTSSRLSHMQSARDKELAEVRAANQKAQEEIGVLTKRLSQMESHRVSVQSTTMETANNGDRSSTMSATVRKSNSVQSLPSPPPAIPLPPLPDAGSSSTEVKEIVSPQRLEEQEARIRTIEKHLFAEKQLTATLEEALTDIEKDGKKVKGELETWKKKCWEYEDELNMLRKERNINRDSLQAIEAEKAGRLRAEKAREALEERMAVLNASKKKKKSSLNCF